MDNDDIDSEKVKTTILEINLLEQEYEVTLTQYQEAIQTYINNLSENDCSLYKITDDNISQLCYDKIWHEQGCLTEAPQVNADKTLDQLVKKSNSISLAKNDDDAIKCYGDISLVPLNNIILNGNFNNPEIDGNSFKYISGNSEVPNWTFGGAALMNNSSAWGYPLYPKGSQAVSIQVSSYIYQSVNLKKNVEYSLNFSCCGRSCCSGVNDIKVELYDDSQQKVMRIMTIKPELFWKEYRNNFTSPDTQTYNLRFSGTSQSADKSSAIQEIKLIEKKNAVYPNIMDYLFIQGKTWWGTEQITERSVETQSECAALCEADVNCSGATFNPTKKMCWISSGESEITPGLNEDNSDGTDYAVIKKLKYNVMTIKSLNEKLISLNSQIIDKMKNIKSEIETAKYNSEYNSEYMEKYNDSLVRQQHDITDELNNYENIEAEYNNSSIYVKQQNWSYNIYAILAFIFIIITFKKMSEGDNMIPFFIGLGIIWAFYIFIIKFYKKNK